MLRPNDKQRVLDHYNRASPYYRELWHEHLHHGYWIRGDESKEVAQLQLVEHLASAAKFVGITISPPQVEMANQAGCPAGILVTILCMDAESMYFAEPFDFLWSIEAISHYQDVPRFFSNAAKLLKPDGTFALADWFKQESLPPHEHQKFLRPIENGMLVELHTMLDYQAWLAAAGLQVTRSDVLNQHTARTWDFCLDIIKDKAIWKFAARHGPGFLRILHAFKAMRAGFSSGQLRLRSHRRQQTDAQLATVWV
jgi:tocopherol O-methyltransferase